MLWALHDSDDRIVKSRGAFAVDREEAEQLNQEGFGIFWTANRFEGRRLVANATEVRFWFCELDKGTKPEQVARLERSPLLPTAVVESKRGFHAYWRAANGSLENWKRITRWGIVPRLRGDPKATDVVRILRAPGFLHLKDPKNPFLVRTVWKLDAEYTELQMMRAFPDARPKLPVPQERVALEPGEGTFWQRVAGLDARKALLRLNGHWLVKGESFRLAEQPNGCANIIRSDGYSTGCFVNERGRLGGVEDGGSVAAWCKWYGWSWRQVADGLREVFPELGGHDEEIREEAPAREP